MAVDPALRRPRRRLHQEALLRNRMALSDNQLNRLLLNTAALDTDPHLDQWDPMQASTSSSSPNFPYSLPTLYGSISADDLHRVPSHLEDYRRRIDAGVEDQRRQRDILEALQDKLLKCRQRPATQPALHRSHFRWWLGYADDAGEGSGDEAVEEEIEYLNLIEYSGFGGSNGLRECNAERRRKRKTGKRQQSDGATRRRRRPLRHQDSQENIGGFGADAAIAASSPLLELLREEQSRGVLLEQVVIALQRQLASSERLNADLTSFTKTSSAPQQIGGQKQAAERKLVDLESDVKSDLRRQADSLSHMAENLRPAMESWRNELISRKMEEATLSEQLVEKVMSKYDDLLAEKTQVEHQLHVASRRERDSAAIAQQNKERLAEMCKRIRQLPEFVEAMGSLGRRGIDGNSLLEGGSDAATSSTPVELAEEIRAALANGRRKAAEMRLEVEKTLEECNRLRQLNSEADSSLWEVKVTLERERSERRQRELNSHSVEARCSELKNKLDNAKESLSELRSELATSRQQLIHAEERHQHEVQELSLRLSQEQGARVRGEELALEQLRNDMKAESAARRAEVEQLRAQLRTRVEEVHRLREELEANTRRAEQARREEDKQGAAIRQLCDEVASLNGAKQELGTLLEEAWGRLRALSTQIQQLLADRRDLPAALQAEIEVEIAKFHEENIGLRERLAAQEVAMRAKTDELEAEAQEWRAKLATAQQLSASQHEFIEELEEKFGKTESDNDKLQQELEECKGRLFEMKEQKREGDELAAAQKAQQNAEKDSAVRELEIKLAELRKKLHVDAEASRQENLKTKELEMELSLSRERSKELETRLKLERESHEGDLERAGKASSFTATMRERELQREISKLAEERDRLADAHKLLQKQSAEVKLLSQQAEDELKSENEALSERMRLTKEEMERKAALVEDAHHKEYEEWASERTQLMARHKTQVAELSALLEKGGEAIKAAEESERTMAAKLGDVELHATHASELISSLRAQLDEAGQREADADRRATCERNSLLAEISELKKERQQLRELIEEEHRRSTQLERENEMTRLAEERLQLRLHTLDTALADAKEKLGRWPMREAEWQAEKAALNEEIANAGRELAKKTAQHCQRCIQHSAEKDALAGNLAEIRREAEADMAGLARRLQLASEQAEEERRKLMIAEKELLQLGREHSQCVHRLSTCRREVESAKETLEREREHRTKLAAEGEHSKGEALVLRAKMQRLESQLRKSEAELSKLRGRAQTPKQRRSSKGRDGCEGDANASRLPGSASSSASDGEMEGKRAGQRKAPRWTITTKFPSVPRPDKASTSKRGVEGGEGLESETEGHITVATGTHRWVINKRTLNIDGDDEKEALVARLKELSDAIAQLQEEKECKMEELRMVREELEKCRNDGSELRDKIRRLEWESEQRERARNSLEHQLASCRQLLATREEDSNAQETDKKSLKMRLLTYEMHFREKESAIRSLQERLDLLGREVAELDEWKRGALAREAGREAENHRPASVTTTQRMIEIREEYSRVVKEREDTTIRLQEADTRLAAASRRIAELERTTAAQQESLGTLRMIEAQWREQQLESGKQAHTPSAASLAMEAKQQAKSALEATKIALNAAKIRCHDVEREKEALRRELLEARSRLTSTAARADALHTRVGELEAERKQLAERLEAVERMERSSFTGGKRFEREVERLQAEKLALVAEIDQQAHKLSNASSVERELRSQLARAERERAAFRQHVEALELDKQRIEAIIRQTTIERHALEKSLKTMEKENSELYRQCNQLQASVSQQLEAASKASGEHSQHFRKRQSQLEADLRRSSREKCQLERVLSQREHNYEEGRRSMELQLRSMRSQLEQEKRKRMQAMPLRRHSSQQQLYENTANCNKSSSSSVFQASHFQRVHSETRQY